MTSKSPRVHIATIIICHTYNNMITFATAWYDVGAKFDKTVYINWMQNLLPNVRNFYLVIYTDIANLQMLRELSRTSPNVTIIPFPFKELPLYKKHYQDFMRNHERNTLLNGRTGPLLNILWCSKQFFVEYTEMHSPVKTDYYGWLDIGYFRARPNKRELTPHQIQEFPRDAKLTAFDSGHIHYGIVSPAGFEAVHGITKVRTETGLPAQQIPADQISVSGGFFVLGKGGVATWWRTKFEEHITKYFEAGYLIKDDQIVVADLITLYQTRFRLWTEPSAPTLDNWFMFQRHLF